MQRDKRIVAYFFSTESGFEPVRDGLLNLDKSARRVIGEDLKYVEENWKVDRPHVDQLRKGSGSSEKTLYELRSSVDGGNQKQEYRIIFFVYRNQMILVHMFLKKSSKVPKIDIELAKKRMKVWLSKQKKI